MQKLVTVFIFPILLFLLIENSRPAHASFIQQVATDYHDYYAQQGIPYFIGGLVSSGVIANTHLDLSLQLDWQQHIRSPFTNKLSNYVDSYGEIAQYKISVPIYLASMWLGSQNPHLNPLGCWANHSLRSLLLGAPQQAFLTHLLGSYRPYGDSHWYWFKSDRAVSGHAFYGAIPFLNVAQQTSNGFVKTTAYILSVLPALARINNNKHYPSQVWLGWWLAFSATHIVWHEAQVSRKPHWNIELLPTDRAIYLGVNAKL